MDWGWGWLSHAAQARGNGSYRQEHPWSILAKGFALDRHILCLPHVWICTRCTFPACPFESHADTAASSCHCALRGCRVPHPQLPSILASPGSAPPSLAAPRGHY